MNLSREDYDILQQIYDRLTKMQAESQELRVILKQERERDELQQTQTAKSEPKKMENPDSRVEHKVCNDRSAWVLEKKVYDSEAEEYHYALPGNFVEHVVCEADFESQTSEASNVHQKLSCKEIPVKRIYHKARKRRFQKVRNRKSWRENQVTSATPEIKTYAISLGLFLGVNSNRMKRRDDSKKGSRKKQAAMVTRLMNYGMRCGSFSIKNSLSHFRHLHKRIGHEPLFQEMREADDSVTLESRTYRVGKRVIGDTGWEHGIHIGSESKSHDLSNAFSPHKPMMVEVGKALNYRTHKFWVTDHGLENQVLPLFKKLNGHSRGNIKIMIGRRQLPEFSMANRFWEPGRLLVQSVQWDCIGGYCIRNRVLSLLQKIQWMSSEWVMKGDMKELCVASKKGIKRLKLPFSSGLANHVWKPGGISSEPEELKGIGKCHKFNRLIRSMEKLHKKDSQWIMKLLFYYHDDEVQVLSWLKEWCDSDSYVSCGDLEGISRYGYNERVGETRVIGESHLRVFAESVGGKHQREIAVRKLNLENCHGGSLLEFLMEKREYAARESSHVARESDAELEDLINHLETYLGENAIHEDTNLQVVYGSIEGETRNGINELWQRNSPSRGEKLKRILQPELDRVAKETTNQSWYSLEQGLLYKNGCLVLPMGSPFIPNVMDQFQTLLLEFLTFEMFHLLRPPEVPSYKEAFWLWASIKRLLLNGSSDKEKRNQVMESWIEAKEDYKCSAFIEVCVQEGYSESQNIKTPRGLHQLDFEIKENLKDKEYEDVACRVTSVDDMFHFPRPPERQWDTVVSWNLGVSVIANGMGLQRNMTNFRFSYSIQIDDVTMTIMIERGVIQLKIKVATKHLIFFHLEDKMIF